MKPSPTNPKTLTPGRHSSYTATVTNVGPDTATDSQFTTALQLSPTGIPVTTDYRSTAVTVTGLGTHRVGDLAPGQSRSATITVTGHTPGTHIILGVSGSTSAFVASPGCTTNGCTNPRNSLLQVPCTPTDTRTTCLFDADQAIAIATTAPPVTSTSPTAKTATVPAATTATQPALANTGTASNELSDVGLGLIALGFVLSYLGREGASRSYAQLSPDLTARGLV